MSDSRRGDPDQEPSAWQDNADVLKSLNSEDRDPRRIQIQQLWVYLEQHKREMAQGDTQTADEVLRMAQTLYEEVSSKLLRHRNPTASDFES